MLIQQNGFRLMGKWPAYLFFCITQERGEFLAFHRSEVRSESVNAGAEIWLGQKVGWILTGNTIHGNFQVQPFNILLSAWLTWGRRHSHKNNIFEGALKSFYSYRRWLYAHQRPETTDAKIRKINFVQSARNLWKHIRWQTREKVSFLSHR